MKQAQNEKNDGFLDEERYAVIRSHLRKHYHSYKTYLISRLNCLSGVTTI